MKNKIIINLKKYKTIIFDCDGVILNSNKIKTEGFLETVKEFSFDSAKELINYHQINGGISRYKKFDFYIKNIAPKYNLINSDICLEKLLEKYKLFIKQKLIDCEICPYLSSFKLKTNASNWIVISGSDQNELREVFEIKNISDKFEGGIFGSPHTKEFIIEREISKKNIKFPALFIGDSKYDYKAARDYDIDFLFITCWTDLKGWEKFVKDNQINFITNLNQIA